MPTTLENEPTAAQQHVIDEIRVGHHTVGCARYQPYGTRAWLVAVFDDERREIKRWRVLPNGDVYEVLPGTPSAEQSIDPPDDEPLAGEPARLEPDEIEAMLAFGREHGIPALLDHLGLDEFGNDVARLLARDRR